MEFSLNTDDIVDLLMRRHDVDPANERLLRARLKHFQRMGVPEDVNPGRGRAAAYGVKQLFQVVLAFEMLDVGLPPDRAKFVVSDWEAISDGLIFAAEPQDGNVKQVYLEFHPSVLAPLRSSTSAINRLSPVIAPRTAEDLSNRISSALWYDRPAALINLTELIFSVAELLIPLRPGLHIWTDIKNWKAEVTNGNS